MFTPNIIPTKHAEPSKNNKKMTMKKVKFFPLSCKNKKKIYFFLVNTKHISSHVLKISAISLVLCTREITNISNTLDEIYLVFTSKNVNILYLFHFQHFYVSQFLEFYGILLLYILSTNCFSFQADGKCLLFTCKISGC